MIEYKSGSEVLAYAPLDQTPLPSQWPAQDYPFYSDFLDASVVEDPACREAEAALRQHEPVLLVGKESSGKTFTTHKLAAVLFEEFSVRFYDGPNLYSSDHALRPELVNDLDIWAEQARAAGKHLLAIVEDIHKVGALIPKFPQQVKRVPISWLFTSRTDQPFMEILTIQLEPNESWLREVVERLSAVVSERFGKRLPVDSVVHELSSKGQPDLRALGYLVRRVVSHGELLPTDAVTDSILRYIWETSLNTPGASSLLRLCAIAQFEAVCDQRFVHDLSADLARTKKIEEVRGDHAEQTFVTLDAGFAKWCLAAARRYGLGSTDPRDVDRLVTSLVCSYIEQWRGRSFELIGRVVETDLSFAREILPLDSTFEQIRFHISSCPPGVFVQILRALEDTAKQDLARQPGAPDLIRYLRTCSGSDFGPALYELSKNPLGRQAIAAIDRDVLVEKLNEAKHFNVCRLVFVALRERPEILRYVAEHIDYEAALGHCHDLGPVVGAAGELSKQHCEVPLLAAARAYPIEKLATLARRSRLARIGFFVRFLSRDEQWPVETFLEECGPLKASFRAEPIRRIADFLHDIRYHSRHRRGDTRKRALNRLSNSALASVTHSGLKNLREIGLVSRGLIGTKNRRKPFTRFLPDRDHRSSSLINEASLTEVRDLVGTLLQIDHPTLGVGPSIAQGRKILGLVHHETWQRWLTVESDDWQRVLDAVCGLMYLGEEYFNPIPVVTLLNRLQEFAAADIDVRKRCLESLTVNQFADLLRQFGRAGIARTLLLDACDEEIVHRWTDAWIQSHVPEADRIIGITKLMRYLPGGQEIPNWASSWLEQYPYTSLTMNPKMATCLNELLFVLVPRKLPVCIKVLDHLESKLTEEGTLQKIRFERFLYNVTSVKGRSYAGVWLRDHQTSFTKRLLRSSIKDAIFLLWHAWLIDVALALEVTKNAHVVEFLLKQIHNSREWRSNRWQSIALRAMLAVLAVSEDVRPEDDDLAQIPNILQGIANPVLGTLLKYAEYKWGTGVLRTSARFVDRFPGDVELEERLKALFST